ncbi:hypothetical protein JOE26_000219 [Rhodococcus coprophilus]|uniref:Uncharacterized protein n=1 Tax=Rhodococcus coprophilus TaxID=38310 RepID=A0A2X4TU68_9NOCA|nr:hypothetical protein [Rhodococcus coprophilus]SQI29929.1 Uncharacterised protein [Rhodococcus coprophilus]
MSRKRRSSRRTAPTLPPRLSSALRFQEGRFPSQGVSADSGSYRFTVRHTGNSWSLRIYEFESDVGVRTPSTFAIHVLERSTKEECIAIACAFHNLGDSYNEFSFGYRSRLDQAVADVSGTAAGRRSLSANHKDPSPSVAQPVRPPATGSSTSPDHVQTRSNASPSVPPRARPRPARPRSNDPSNTPIIATRSKGRSASRGGARAERSGPHTESPLSQPVYVELRPDRFHTTPYCSETYPIRYWCPAEKAHRSRLNACKKCAGNLDGALRAQLGVITSGERSRLSLPKLHTFHHREYKGERPSRPRRRVKGKQLGKQTKRNRRTPSDDGNTTTFGPPTSVQDVRFTHQSSLGWGTASFGQHPEEFLGSPTDDDHDWRGGSALYE